VTAPSLLEGIDDRSPQGIAAAVARRITEGSVLPGERLPTVREVAAALAVSPATVSTAWQALTRAGLIHSRGRAGSFVHTERPAWVSPRIQSMSGRATAPRSDLSLGTPDPALLPPLGPAFARVSLHVDTGSYHDRPVLPALEEVLRESWPAPVEAITVLDGALDGVERTLEQVVRFGDRILVENPGFPYFFDLAEALGVEAVPLALDAHGVLPASLARGLAAHPAALLLQPRAQNPTGASMTAERAEHLARLLRSSREAERVVVIEDDHSGPISLAPDVTLARWIPDRVVRVRSFSKSHGPDLRMAALGGPAAIVDAIVARRMLGPAWSSRLLQTVLLDLLTDPSAQAAVGRARTEYGRRQAALSLALARRGIALAAADGINAWLPVADARSTSTRLAAVGVSVADGEPFVLGSADDGRRHVRVTVGLIARDVETVAAVLADAAADVHPQTDAAGSGSA
jgi:DNA-binding transcriptional MocR family regulator